jgi:hypothetical protein
VAAAAVKEWPAPTGFTVPPAARAVRITSATSAPLRGRATAVAVAVWLPAQFRQAFAAALALLIAIVNTPHICLTSTTPVAW